MKRASTVEPTISRKDAGLYALVSITFVLIAFLVPGRSTFAYLGGLFFLVLFFLFCLAFIFPGRFKRGVEVIDGGFLHYSPSKGRQLIYYDEINRIVAVCRGDGPEGEDVPLMVWAKKGRVQLSETDLYRTHILDDLFALTGFNRDTYSCAAKYRPSGLDFLVGKKFVLYERA